MYVDHPTQAAREIAPRLPREFKDFRGCHSGETLLVCGCGSSLSQIVAPERVVTIGVNDVGRLFDPDYLMVLNPRQQFTGDRFRYVEQSRAKVVFTQLDLGISHPHVVRFRLGRKGGTDLSDPDSLPYTRNSPYPALCLAMHMGARRIGLIGVDFTDHHFFAPTGRHSLAGEFPQIDREYQQLFESCRRRGIEVFNLSRESRLTAFPMMAPEDFMKDALSSHAARGVTTLAVSESAPEPTPIAAAFPNVFPVAKSKPLRIVSYATTPVAGVPAILSRCIAAGTVHECRTVWATNSYGNGVTFEGDVEWQRSPSVAENLLRAADLVIVHNGKIEPQHRNSLRQKPIITMAHNYMWNVDTAMVQEGFPGVVAGQYQATLAEFQGWAPVPNPVPLWESAYRPGKKDPLVTICYTPSGKHERYPLGHRLYWHSKGYATTMRALESLARRFPLRLDVVRERQFSHSESLAMKSRAHIVIDECVTGSYHRNSLEGLACGCVVVNGIGKLPAIKEMFRYCAGGTEDVPFVYADLDGLEAVLAALIEQGPEALAVQGARNRMFMEQQWNFTRQWNSFWEPVVARAFACHANKHRGVAVSTVPERSGEKVMLPEMMLKQMKPGLSVVMCHGGQERLPQLRASLANLRQCKGVNEVIVVDMGTVPYAEAVARRWADKYIFVRNDDVFERARCLNVGTSIAEYDLVLWMDNDLILPPDFVSNAATEMRARQLDYLIPYVSVNYLSETDSQKVMNGEVRPTDCTPARACRPLYVCGGAGLVRKSFVLTYGGFSEVFRGWGGEDAAWWHKARLLGRAEVVQRQDQLLYHLFHLNSGANGGSAHRDSNPYYARNVAALREMRFIRERNSYLNRYPPQPLFSCPWKGKRVVFVSESAQETDKWSPDQIGSVIAALTNVEVEHRRFTGTWDCGNGLSTDAMVIFGTPGAAAFASDTSLQELRKKAVVVLTGGELDDAVMQRLRGVGGVLCMQTAEPQNLEHPGLRLWPIPGTSDSSDLAQTAALRILQPLSIILGGGMPQTVTDTATCSAGESANSDGGPRRRAKEMLHEVSILITSFLRPGYLKECLAGIEKNLPECKVIVVDDSGGEDLGSGADRRFISLPFDSGLSAKRNAGVKACTTSYLLMGSDDFDFGTGEARAGIEKLVRVLEEHPSVDVAGGHHNNQPYEGFLELMPGSYIKETRLFSSNDQPRRASSLSNEYEVYKVDLIVNYFLARTQSIRLFPWDERMKIGGEHGDWFLTLKDAGKMVVWMPGVNINELPRDRSKEHPDYGRYRGRALSLGHKIFLDKRGIKHYFGFDDPVPAALKPAPKILVAVITCKANADRLKAQQETWIPRAVAAGYDVQIFDGERLGVPDDYYSLIQKTQAMCKWALTQGYNRVLKVDDDCCIRVDQLHPTSHDYAGIVIAANDCGSSVPPGAPAKPKGTYPHNYASGGAYWLSRKAAMIIANALPNGDWAEDRFVGNTLAKHGIFVQRIPDFSWGDSARVPHRWTVLTQVPTPALVREAFR